MLPYLIKEFTIPSTATQNFIIDLCHDLVKVVYYRKYFLLDLFAKMKLFFQELGALGLTDDKPLFFLSFKSFIYLLIQPSCPMAARSCHRL
jgi:hypothetical protein